MYTMYTKSRYRLLINQFQYFINRPHIVLSEKFLRNFINTGWYVNREFQGKLTKTLLHDLYFTRGNKNSFIENSHNKHSAV